MILFRGQTRRKGETVNMKGEPVPSNWVYGEDLSGAAELALKGAETEEDFDVILEHFPTCSVEKVYQVGRPLYDIDGMKY